MRKSQKSLLLAALACAGVFGAASPAMAYWHGHHGYHGGRGGVSFGFYSGPGYAYAPAYYYPPYAAYAYPYSAYPAYYAPPAPPVSPAAQAAPVSPQAEDQYCREYQAAIKVDGHTEPSYGTACRGPDGHWRLMD